MIYEYYRGNRSLTQKTPNYNASLSFNKSRKGLRKRELTPSRNPNFNGIGGGDRFIPTRDSTQFEYANHCLVHHNSEVANIQVIEIFVYV